MNSKNNKEEERESIERRKKIVFQKRKNGELSLFKSYKKEKKNFYKGNESKFRPSIFCNQFCCIICIVSTGWSKMI